MLDSNQGRRTTRRIFLKACVVAGLGATSGLIAQGCTTAPTTQPTAAASAAPAAAVSAQPKPGGTLTFATSIDIPSIEPHLEAADAWHRRKFLIYENLVTIDNDMIIQPQLAEKWEVKDDTVYTFTLRKGVKFHNGKELDADDVKYSLERMIDPKAGQASGDLGAVSKVEAVDKSTLRVTLKEPSGPFLIALAARFNAVIPKDSAPTGDALRQKAIGTGPFAVQEFAPAQRLVLTKNPDYWEKGKPYLDKIVIQVVPDETNIVAGLKAGTIDHSVIEDGKNYLQLQNQATLTGTRTPGLKLDSLDFACDQKPTDNVKVRQAIALALDKPAIMQAALFGLGQIMYAAPPAWKFWALPGDQLANQKRDVTKAKQLLAEAGLGSGFQWKVRNIVGYPTLANCAPVIAANLKEVGIDVTFDTVDLGVWIEDWRARRSPSTLNSWGGLLDPDIMYYRHFHRQPLGMDFRRWNNAKVDELLDKGRGAVEAAKRKPYYDEVQKLIAEEVPVIFFYSADILNVMQKSVQGYVQHPTGYYTGLKSAWLNK